MYNDYYRDGNHGVCPHCGYCPVCGRRSWDHTFPRWDDYTYVTINTADTLKIGDLESSGGTCTGVSNN